MFITPDNQKLFFQYPATYYGEGRKYLGKDFEFTNRIKYTTLGDKTHIDFEITYTIEITTMAAAFKQLFTRKPTMVTITRWLNEWEFQFEDVPVETIVDCNTLGYRKNSDFVLSNHS